MNLAYVAAWIAPLLLGSGIVAALLGRPRTTGEYATTLGCGFVLGVLLCGLAVALQGEGEVARIVPLAAPMLIVAGAALWFLVLRRSEASVPRRRERVHPLLW
ncbi:MAG TPA: hypothetical protein VJ696_10725, partial [Rhodanobacteraceae bacterium]|nr:hypothetical protein [Rhodanobacteraceae bacterium]